jgi:heme/copper-type cytochrome/quinol oxidase subunit 2
MPSERVRADALSVQGRAVPRLVVMAIGLSLLAAGALLAWPSATTPATEDGARREIHVSARRYAFTPDRIEVDQDDLLKITFTAEDIPHSFTIDAYRIAKRAGAGQTVTFEFRADQAGTFPFYCNLALDEGCREMRGELVVREKP